MFPHFFNSNSFLRVLIQNSQDQIFQRFTRISPPESIAGKIQFLAQDQLRQLILMIAPKWHSIVSHREQRNTKCPNIVLFPLKLSNLKIPTLRTHEMISPLSATQSVIIRIFQLDRDSKIANFAIIISCDEDILRLDVTMTNSNFVQVLKPIKHLFQVHLDLILREILLVWLARLELKVISVPGHDLPLLAIIEN